MENSQLNHHDISKLFSFEAVYTKFYRSIYRYVRKHISSSPVAEEITQDIFLKIHQNKASFDSRFELSSWIWAIARNTVFDQLRKIRNKHPSHTQSLDDPVLKCHFEPSSDITAETLMLDETERKKLQELINHLSHKQQEAIFLRLVNKFSYREISASMNLSLSAVKSLINRGKTTLVTIAQNEAQQSLELL
jgi:RNA polymerase sigma-70 factor (ECF subfamily)